MLEEKLKALQNMIAKSKSRASICPQISGLNLILEVLLRSYSAVNMKGMTVCIDKFDLIKQEHSWGSRYYFMDSATSMMSCKINVFLRHVPTYHAYR